VSCQAGPTVPRTRSVHHSAGSYPYRQARQGLAARFSCPSTPKTLQYSMLTATERGCSQSKYVVAKISRSSVRVLRSCAVAGKAIRRVARASGSVSTLFLFPAPLAGVTSAPAPLVRWTPLKGRGRRILMNDGPCRSIEHVRAVGPRRPVFPCAVERLVIGVHVLAQRDLTRR
jgi:hypothetical protein